MNRRSFLIGLSSILPAAQFLLRPALASAATTTAADSSILAVSRIITGNPQLAPEIAERVASVLAKRITGFDDKLAALAKALSAGGTRDAALAALTPDEITFALEIAKPWYVGYVGTPSNTLLKDDAEFVTFLGAQTYEKLIDVLPRPSYSNGAPGWWAAVPEGIDASDLPEGIESWSYQPKMPSQIAAPDPAWRAFVTGKYPSIEAAKAALAAPAPAASPATAPAAAPAAPAAGTAPAPSAN